MASGPQEALSSLSPLDLLILCISVFPSRLGGFNFVIPLGKRNNSDSLPLVLLLSGWRISQSFKFAHMSWKPRPSVFHSKLWAAQPL